MRSINIMDIQFEMVRSDKTLDIDGYMLVLNEDITNPEVKESIIRAGAILDNHERISLDNLWKEYVMMAINENNTGITEEMTDEPTGEI